MIKALLDFIAMTAAYFLIIAVIVAVLKKYNQRRHFRKRLKSYLPDIEDIEP